MDDRLYWKNERIAFLALTHLKGVGFWTLHKIAQSGEDFKETLQALGSAGFGAGNEEWSPEALWAEGLALARKLRGDNVRLLFRDESSFPPKLKDIPEAPFWIFLQGDPQNLVKPAITVVGTRKPSEDGLFLTRCVIASLAGSGLITVSGLASGIDQTVHEESLRYKLPTVAVLGTGIMQNYPRGSEGLRKSLLDAGGTVVSEYLPYQSYSAENFVRRNRLQAAIGDVLVPVEWKVKSGTAHTVKFAHTYNREIINVFLPFSEELRPELRFSKSEYSAEAILMPAEAGALMGRFRDELSSREFVLSAESYSSPMLEENDDQKSSNSQLSLI